MNYINLTPHAISILVNDEVVTIQPSGVVARVATKDVVVDTVDGVDIIETVYGPVEGLSEFNKVADDACIVSALVLSQLDASWHMTAFAPATGPAHGAVRNEKGHIEYVTKLITVPAAK